MEDQFDETTDQTQKEVIVPDDKTEDTVRTDSESTESPISEETEMNQPEQEIKADEKIIYTDPNSGIVKANTTEHEGQYQYEQNMGGSHAGAQGQQYNSNYEYNTTSSTTGYKADYYEEKEDNSPMSLGDWLLTILALIIPCAGIILYFVWAFGKDVNVNRRNYCRAALIVEGVKIVLGMIIGIIFLFALAASGNYYY